MTILGHGHLAGTLAFGAPAAIEVCQVVAHLRGQVFSTVASLNFVAMAVGSGLAGPVHAAFGTAVTLMLFTLFEFISAGIWLTSRSALRGRVAHV